MSLRILMLFVTSLSLFALLIAANGQSKDHRDTTTGLKTQQTRTRATAKVTVQSSEVKAYDQTTSPALTEIHITETFSGDIDGEPTVRALALQRDDKSASQVSMQRFSGKLAGRQGAFVLQGSETVSNGKIKATWFVVPGSVTIALPRWPRGRGAAVLGRSPRDNPHAIMCQSQQTSSMARLL